MTAQPETITRCLTPPKYQAERIAAEQEARLRAAWNDGFRAALPLTGEPSA